MRPRTGTTHGGYAAAAGALQPGAPELRPDARYNQDIENIVKRFDLGMDVLTVVFETPNDSCNNYEVLNLGVRGPAQSIIDTANKEGADVIGLSGLITPSLEEMAHVAREMERAGLKLQGDAGGSRAGDGGDGEPRFGGHGDGE